MSGAVIAGVIVLIVAVAAGAYFMGFIPGTAPYHRKIVETWYKERKCADIVIDKVAGVGPRTHATEDVTKAYDELDTEVQKELDDAHAVEITACCAVVGVDCAQAEAPLTAAQIRIEMVNRTADNIISAGTVDDYMDPVNGFVEIVDNEEKFLDPELRAFYEIPADATPDENTAALAERKVFGGEVRAVVNTKMQSALNELSGYSAGEEGEWCQPDPVEDFVESKSISDCAAECNAATTCPGFNFSPSDISVDNRPQGGCSLATDGCTTAAPTLGSERTGSNEYIYYTKA